MGSVPDGVKRLSTTVWPITATGAPADSSAWVYHAPALRLQVWMAWKLGYTPCTRVFQLRPPLISWALTATTGLTLTTCGTAPMAQASCSGNDCCVPAPDRATTVLVAPGCTTSVVVPRPTTRWLMSAAVPWVSVTTAMTAATPTTTPSAVNSERRRLAHSAVAALLKLGPICAPRRWRTVLLLRAVEEGMGALVVSVAAGMPVSSGALMPAPPESRRVRSPPVYRWGASRSAQ